MSTDTRQYITMLMLPWFDNDNELQFSTMSLFSPERPVCARKARRIARKWYKTAIGKTVPKEVLERVWRRKFITRTKTEEEAKKQLEAMVRRADEETETESDITVQGQATQGTE